MRTPIKAIRAKCIDCSGGSTREVRLCPVVNCELYPYRLGKNPSRKGIGPRQGKLKKALVES